MIGNDFFAYVGCGISTLMSLDIIKLYVMMCYTPFLISSKEDL